MLLATAAAYAQATSRMIPFSGIQTTLQPGTTQPLTVQMWDDAAAGTLIVAEDQPAVGVDEAGRISFLFGSTSGGLNPDHFPSGATRFLDVVEPGTGASVLAGGRIALNAVAFALSPGPAGPAGPEGPRGPEGPPGPPGEVSSVSAADSSIIIGGTASAPNVAVANNGINNTKVADGALSPAKIAGTAATLGANAFSGNQGISGELSATGVISTGVQYNIGGSRVVSIAGTNNLFVGVGAGMSTTGSGNAFFGSAAGISNTTGGGNAFFGDFAGQDNTTGGFNAFFGSGAGQRNTADGNAFFGAAAGQNNTTGSSNAFFGRAAGRNNTTGDFNAFFGDSVGRNNTTGGNNAFFGSGAGFANTTGGFNAFFGAAAGQNNSTGSDNAFFGDFAGQNNSTGRDNSFFGSTAGSSNTTENRNTFIGASSNGAAGITNATAIGADAVVMRSNSLVLGNNANVGIGISAPVVKLHVGGNAIITGTLSKGGGSFKIDHPLDPENRYLSHSFVESPDMMNIYNGIVTLDAKGQAIVTLPQWFNALNKDFRYQLTCIGGFAPVYIAKKITGNRFKIAGGKRGMEVSWQVTGIRQDAYANAHRIRVEEDKPAQERGTYLHPEAFGQPQEKGVTHARHSAATQPAEEEAGKEITAAKRTATGRR